MRSLTLNTSAFISILLEQSNAVFIAFEMPMLLVSSTIGQCTENSAFCVCCVSVCFVLFCRLDFILIFLFIFIFFFSSLSLTMAIPKQSHTQRISGMQDRREERKKNRMQASLMSAKRNRVLYILKKKNVYYAQCTQTVQSFLGDGCKAS